VIQNPRRLLSAEEKRAKLGAPAPPADKPRVPRWDRRSDRFSSHHLSL